MPPEAQTPDTRLPATPALPDPRAHIFAAADAILDLAATGLPERVRAKIAFCKRYMPHHTHPEDLCTRMADTLRDDCRGVAEVHLNAAAIAFRSAAVTIVHLRQRDEARHG